MRIMRTSTAILLLFGSVSAVLHHHEPKPECATCAEKIVEAKNQVYTLVFQFPDETSNTTLCAYQEMREGKEPKNEGYCGYDSKGDLVNNKDDLGEMPACCRHGAVPIRLEQGIFQSVVRSKE